MNPHQPLPFPQHTPRPPLRHPLQLGLLLCLLMGQGPAPAQTQEPAPAAESPIGYVKTVSGPATVNSQGQLLAARPGLPLYLGSQLKTGPGASLGITLQDDTLMSFGPNAELTLDAYQYAPEQGQFQLVARLLRGTLNYVSGLIAKLQPEAVTIKTPSGIIGVRGTQFVVKVEDSKP